MPHTGRYTESGNDRSGYSHYKLENISPKLLFHTKLILMV